MDGQPTSAPELSVIMPVRNMEATLPRAIESVLVQDYADYELLVVLNGSTDSSCEIAMSYAQEYSAIRVIENGTLGYSSTCNRGMHEARGKFVMFLDADDYYLPGAFGALVQAMADLDCDVVYSRRSWSDGSAAPSTEQLDVNCALMLLDGMRHRAQADYPKEQVAALNVYAQWGNIYKASFLERHGIQCDTTLTTGEDFLFNRDVLRHYPTAYALNCVVYENRYMQRTDAQIRPERFEAAVESVEAVLANWPQKGFANRDEAYGFASVMFHHLAGNVVRSGMEETALWLEACFARPAIRGLIAWTVEKGDVESLHSSLKQHNALLDRTILQIVAADTGASL